MDTQVKRLALLQRRVKTILKGCDLMTDAEYERARDYIRARHKVEIPFEKRNLKQTLTQPNNSKA